MTVQLTAGNSRALAFLEENVVLGFLRALDASLEEPTKRMDVMTIKKASNGNCSSVGKLYQVTGSNYKRSRKMAQIAAVSKAAYEGVLNGQKLNMRSVFYQDNLFPNTDSVSTITDDLVNTADCSRIDFNLADGLKGAIIACPTMQLRIAKKEEQGEDIAIGFSSVTIPQNDVVKDLVCEIEPAFVLIVEKATILSTLANASFFAKSGLPPGIIVTCRGQPDFNTRHFLRRVADRFPSAKFGIVVDCNIGGLEILCVYKYGSKAQRTSTEMRGVPLGSRLQWLGLTWAQVQAMGCPSVQYKTIATEKSYDWIKGMLRRKYVDHEIRSEARKLKDRGTYADVEIVTHRVDVDDASRHTEESSMAQYVRESVMFMLSARPTVTNDTAGRRRRRA